MLCLLGGILSGCNDDVTPPIPVIKEYDLTLMDKADVPVSKALVSVFMSHKPDVLVMSKNTDIFGKVHFLNLKPGNYIFTAAVNETEIMKSDVVVADDNTLNIATVKTNYEMKVGEYKIVVKSDRGKPIIGRKIDLLTKDDQILYRSDVTNEKGELIFTKIPLDNYLFKVYDEMNEVTVQTESISVIEDVSKNTSNVEIIKLVHSSDIVITGLFVDPSGSDCPKVGAVSGGGFTHTGGYEYIQLMALKDINFDETPYCVITGMNATNPTDKTYPAALDSWASSKGQNTKTTYQMDITSGSVKKGQFFYVGGISYMIAGYYNDWGSPVVEKTRWWAFDFYNKRGSGDNGSAKGGSGIFNNLNGDRRTNVPDGVAVFKGTNIDKNTVPQDVVFYGGESPIRSEDRYLITDNDLYRTVNSKGEAQPYFGDGTNLWFAKQGFHDDGCYIMMGGEVTTTEWLKPRVGKLHQLRVKDGPESVSVADIENADGVTVFVDK